MKVLKPWRLRLFSILAPTEEDAEPPSYHLR